MAGTPRAPFYGNAPRTRRTTPENFRTLRRYERIRAEPANAKYSSAPQYSNVPLNNPRNSNVNFHASPQRARMLSVIASAACARSPSVCAALIKQISYALGAK